MVDISYEHNRWQGAWSREFKKLAIPSFFVTGTVVEITICKALQVLPCDVCTTAQKVPPAFRGVKMGRRAKRVCCLALRRFVGNHVGSSLRLDPTT